MVHLFLTEDEGRSSPFDMWLVLKQPVEPKDNVVPINIGYRALRVLVRVPMVMVNGRVLCFTKSMQTSATLILYTREGPSRSLASLQIKYSQGICWHRYPVTGSGAGAQMKMIDNEFINALIIGNHEGILGQDFYNHHSTNFSRKKLEGQAWLRWGICASLTDSIELFLDLPLHCT